jgi:hypothetical protein
VNTSQLDDVSEALRAIAVAFSTVKCRYLIGGSFASSVQGEFRATNDIDVLSELLPKNVDLFLGSLGADFIVDEVGLRESVARRATFNIIHEPSFIKIDLFFARDDFHNEELMRAVEVTLPSSGVTVCVASPEDIILMKLSWFKRGGETSQRQWRDIQGVLRVQSSGLDRNYLEKWAKLVGVELLLAKAFQEYGEA